MDKEKILRIYLEHFHKYCSRWAQGAESYETRHKKQPFGDIITEMNRFARRYLGEGNYMAYNEHLVYYLMKHGYIFRDEFRRYDVTPEKFAEYLVWRG